MSTTNQEIADQLDQIADLLDLQEDANPFRVRAYRRGADRVRAMKRPIIKLLEEAGHQSLETLPEIGESLAGVIIEIALQGRSSLLERLQSEVAPTKVLQQVPGIGNELAERIVRQLDVSTLAELEQAAHDGRLAQVPGFGEERVRNVKVSLAGMLSGAAQRHAREVGEEDMTREEPPIDLLLEIDREYRERAKAGELRKIAPKRFNPNNEAWLPVMELDRGGWHFTALYSNTARAHELGMTHDWVVIYFRRDGKENQVTVVTETRGPLAGKRVVRGRENDARRYYEKRETDGN